MRAFGRVFGCSPTFSAVVASERINSIRAALKTSIRVETYSATIRDANHAASRTVARSANHLCANAAEKTSPDPTFHIFLLGNAPIHVCAFGVATSAPCGPHFMTTATQDESARNWRAISSAEFLSVKARPSDSDANTTSSSADEPFSAKVFARKPSWGS